MVPAGVDGGGTEDRSVEHVVGTERRESWGSRGWRGRRGAILLMSSDLEVWYFVGGPLHHKNNK